MWLHECALNYNNMSLLSYHENIVHSFHNIMIVTHKEARLGLFKCVSAFHVCHCHAIWSCVVSFLNVASYVHVDIKQRK